jgi:Fe2+ or Zn2+ uptake regulation protein
MEEDQSVETTLKWALGHCREKGLRRTRALEAVLQELIASETPLTLHQLDQTPFFRGRVDRATIYRLLMRLEQHRLVRRIGLHDRSMYFVMNYPHSHRDYLICTACGRIDSLDLACPVEALEDEVSRKSGFSHLYHELEFFGLCPACSA